MGKYDKKIEGARSDRHTAQERIVKRWGAKTIDRAKAKYCYKCRDGGGCLLIPLTEDGQPCPYFRTKGGKE